MPKTTYELTNDIEAAWVGLKMSVLSPGLQYSEIDNLDVFEFFTLLREVHRRNQPK